MAKERPDLKPLLGRKLTVIAWVWARTVKSPNPAFAKIDVPLASTFMLSTKVDKEAYVETVADGSGYLFRVKTGKPKDAKSAKSGTKLSSGANFRCLMSGSTVEAKYIRSEAQAGRMGARLMAVVADGAPRARTRCRVCSDSCTLMLSAPSPQLDDDDGTEIIEAEPFAAKQFCKEPEGAGAAA